jgi:hypothetical protein
MSLKDITNRVTKLKRGSALLYRNRNPEGIDPPSYRGVLRVPTGELYWVAAWGRTVHGKVAIEITLSLKSS